jgi:hypothetical protein
LKELDSQQAKNVVFSSLQQSQWRRVLRRSNGRCGTPRLSRSTRCAPRHRPHRPSSLSASPRLPAGGAPHSSGVLALRFATFSSDGATFLSGRLGPAGERGASPSFCRRHVRFSLSAGRDAAFTGEGRAASKGARPFVVSGLAGLGRSLLSVRAKTLLMQAIRSVRSTGHQRAGGPRSLPVASAERLEERALPVAEADARRGLGNPGRTRPAIPAKGKRGGRTKKAAREGPAFLLGSEAGALGGRGRALARARSGARPWRVTSASYIMEPTGSVAQIASKASTVIAMRKKCLISTPSSEPLFVHLVVVL